MKLTDEQLRNCSCNSYNYYASQHSKLCPCFWQQSNIPPSVELAKDMTLRDYFAMQTMVVVLSKLSNDDIIEVAVSYSYAVADQMMKARAKQ